MIQGWTILDFSVVSIMLLFCAIMLFSKQLVQVLSAFFGVLVTIALVFLISGSGFLFVTQLLLYVAGVAVLIVFTIMLSSRITDNKNIISSSNNATLVWLIIAALIGSIVLFIQQPSNRLIAYKTDEVKGIGIGIMSNYLIAFELLGIFLLMALILTVIIAGKKGNK